ncbi:MAG: hypothetical protein HC809_00745 [Gammaproteobacteria bacterium]|nr:hypothetical protein [Gammaproteobacteria bacterium]
MALIDIEAARELLIAAASGHPLESELISIDAARNRVTATPVVAPMNVPPFTASAMDATPSTVQIRHSWGLRPSLCGCRAAASLASQWRAPCNRAPPRACLPGR